MDNAQFIYVSLGLLVILIAIAAYLFRKHKYNSRDIAAQMVRAQTMSYDPSDPAFKQVSHRKAVIGLILGFTLLLIDWLAGFPNINGAAVGRGFYVLIILLSAYVLFSDYRDKKKSKKS